MNGNKVQKSKMKYGAEKVMDLIDEIMNLFDYMLEKATIDMKDFELQKEIYRKKLIKLFELNDKL